jgi:hypothetical protein
MQIKQVRNKSDTNHYPSNDSGIVVDYRSTPSHTSFVVTMAQVSKSAQRRRLVHSTNKLPCIDRGLK